MKLLATISVAVSGLYYIDREFNDGRDLETLTRMIGRLATLLGIY